MVEAEIGQDTGDHGDGKPKHEAAALCLHPFRQKRHLLPPVVFLNSPEGLRPALFRIGAERANRLP